jgi:hypothetical protein
VIFRLRCILALIVALGVSSLAASTGESHHAFSPARQVEFEVSDYRDSQGKTWIHLHGRFECEYGQTVDDIVATLRDFENAPKVFSRIEAIKVRSVAGSIVVTEQRSAVRVLGLAFISNLVFKNELEQRDSDSAKVSFELVESDGSCLSTLGSWTLEDRSGPSGPTTYAIFMLDSLVQPRFPGQAAIMRSFGAGDLKRTMRELGLSVKRS